MIGRKIFNQVEEVCVSRRGGICIKRGGTNICTLLLLLGVGVLNMLGQFLVLNILRSEKDYL